MKLKLKSYTPALLGIALMAASCSKDDSYKVPTAKNELQNEVIKRTISPNIVGGTIEFAYAMALPQTKGKLVSAQVEASIAGATGTWMENKSYYYDVTALQDVGIQVASPSVTTNTTTVTTFTKDTNAVTLRFYYVVPEEARGKTVSFTFSAKSSDGATVSAKMGPFNVSKMDMKLDLGVTDGDSTYISIADMKVYRKSDAISDPSKIDLIYMFRSGGVIGHCLVAPGAPKDYLQDFLPPNNVTNATKIIKVYGLRDQQLARAQYGVFIDDVDFVQQSFTTAPNAIFQLKTDGSGAWVETADGKYRAYIYCNVVDDAKKRMTISIKRYTMK
ncbi:DUF4466 family protein [Chitinophaga sp. Cy-1792]|uniref:DUF4466 family protein n=1 Tax=Chitinophaga sp. Cy-1792 TaxID=2608339 RepID=UPI00141FBF1C|nr:DUF4466 family protein [Chitinophaga sp. Cy-1792]NIG56028.1 DUF4466 domain-containing protein [Chitinophaga sp. Cy-1792]